MTAADLGPDVHLQGFVFRPGEYDPQIPVVHRARRRSRAGLLRWVDVTWTCGSRCRYLPTAELAVLEA